MRSITLFVIALSFLVSQLAYASDRTYGEITKVVADKHLLYIAAECSCGSGKVIEMTFTLKDSTKVLLNLKDSKLADLKTGDEVAIDFEDTPDKVLKVAATREDAPKDTK